MKKFNWIVLLFIVTTMLLLLAVIFIGNRFPIKITCQSPKPCDQVSSFGSIVFEFSRPVQTDQVETLWQTNPAVEGKWEWLDSQHVRWNSLNPLPSNKKIVLEISTGLVGQNGEQIKDVVQWEVMVRTPRIVVLGNEGPGQELFSYELEDGSPGMQISQTDGKVLDFQASPDGEQVVFSALNKLFGIDLWIVQRDGSNQRKLLDCGSDRCTTPAWSPYMQELAYTREGAGIDPNGPNGAPRIWILDINSGQTSSLFADPQKIGYGPKWSPDGQWLSIWNGSQKGIEVVNRKSGETFILELANGDVGSWTSNS